MIERSAGVSYGVSGLGRWRGLGLGNFIFFFSVYLRLLE